MKTATKKQAEKAYYEGKEVILTPSKCGLGSMFQATIQRNTGYCNEENFDKIVNSFRYYNCQLSETGLGVKYYINA